MAGKWFWDDEDLSNLAWNIESRSAGMSVAGRRGDNRRVPGRVGSRYRDKVQDENEFVLSMWAQGCDTDGSLPAGTAATKQVRDNVDTLTRLMAGPGMHELVRVEDSSVQIGRINYIPNPSVENGDGKVIVQENVIQNPSLEYNDPDRPLTTLRRNFADNPSMEAGSREAIFRRNYARNPRMASEGRNKIYRTNYITNPSFEADLRPWTPSNDAIIERSRYSQAAPKWPRDGKWSCRLASTAAGTATAKSATIKVGAAVNCMGAVEILNLTGFTRTIRLQMRFKNKAGTTLQTTNFDVSFVNGQQARITGNVASPASTDSVTLTVVLVAAAAAGEEIYFDKVQFETGAGTIGSYFDGETDEVDGRRNRWVDTAGISISEQYYVRPLGYETFPTSALGVTTGTARVGSVSCLYNSITATGVRELLIRQTPDRGAALEPDSPVSASIWIKLASTITATRTVKAILNCYDSKGTLLGPALAAVGGAATTDSTTTLSNGEWIPVEIEAAYVRPKTATVCMELYTGEAWAAGDTAHIDTLTIEDTTVLEKYFDGDHRDNDTFSFEWEGDAHDSTSLQVGFRPQGWSSLGGRIYRYADSLHGDFSCRVDLPHSPPSALRAGIESTPLQVAQGRTHTLSAWVRSNRTFSVSIGYSINKGVDYTTGTVSAVANTWTRVSLTGITFADTVVEDDIRIAIRQNAAPVEGDLLDIDNVLLEATSDLRDFFCGDSGRGYSWADEAHRSVSLLRLAHPVGWVGQGLGRPQVYRQGGGTNGSWEGVVISTQAGNYGVSAGQDAVDVGTTYAFGVDVKPGAAVTVRAGIDWFKANGDLISSTTADFAGAANTWGRVTVSGTAPATAVVAAPWVNVLSGVSGDQFSFDAAIFGFGALTAYKDGNTASWEWKGDKNLSESFNKAVVPAFWDKDSNGTLTRDGSWSTDRSYGGLYTVVTGSTNNRVWAQAEGDNDQSRFRIILGRSVTFSADIRAVDACRVKFALVPYKWNGWAWGDSTDAPVVLGTAGNGGLLDMTAGQTARMTMYAEVGSRTMNATHFRPEIRVYATGTNNAPTAGTRFRFDSVVLTYYSTDGTYQDGEQAFVRWKGKTDASASKRIGPARRLSVEVKDAVSFDTTGGAMARFAVSCVAPEVYWEDTYTASDTMVIGRNGSILTLNQLAGSTAPILDAVLTMYGPIAPFRITDMASGAYFDYDDRVEEDEQVVIDVGRFNVQNRRGKSLITAVSHKGSPYLLPLTLPSGETAPRVRIEAKNIGKGAKLKVAAKRKYHIG